MNQSETYSKLLKKNQNGELTLQEFMEITAINEQSSLVSLLVIGYGQDLLLQIENEAGVESDTEDLAIFQQMLDRAGISKDVARQMIAWLNKDY